MAAVPCAFEGRRGRADEHREIALIGIGDLGMVDGKLRAIKPTGVVPIRRKTPVEGVASVLGSRPRRNNDSGGGVVVLDAYIADIVDGGVVEIGVSAGGRRAYRDHLSTCSLQRQRGDSKGRIGLEVDC